MYYNYTLYVFSKQLKVLLLYYDNMTYYKININNRNYDSWTIYNATTLEVVTINEFNPLEHKLLTDDVFTYNVENNKLEIIHSSTRINENIPGVLMLVDNKTYGRETTSKKGRLLYKCIPDDMRIPIFLVPYEIKNMGFSKVFINRYVTIRYNSWDNKHPTAKLSQNIGPVDVLYNFYEYDQYY